MSSWVAEVKAVQAELGCSYKEALVEASRRRREGEVPGGYQAPSDDDEESDVEGSGVVSEIGRHFAGMQDALRGNRMNYKPRVRALLEKIGNAPISRLAIVRRPLSILRVVNAYRSMTKRAHDALFHLFVVAVIKGAAYVIEKNEDINVVFYKPLRLDEVRQVPIDSSSELTLSGMLDTTLQRVGAQRMFNYDAFSYNCQRFVMDLLSSNHIDASGYESFVMQDVADLVPSWGKKLIYFITSLANRGKMFIEGRGEDEYTSDTEFE